MFMFHDDIKNIGNGCFYAKGWRRKIAPTAGEVAQIITKYPASPCLWAYGKRSKVNFRYASWLALDFDEGMTLDQAKETFHPYLHIIATTKSHQKTKGDKPACDRFRVILRLAEACTNSADYEETIKPLIYEYNADDKCSDAGRFFWPCKEVITLKWWGKVVPVVDSTEIIRKRKERQEKYKQKLQTSYAPNKAIPGWVRLKLDLGVEDGSRNNWCHRIAHVFHDLGYSESEAFDMIWNSRVPLNNSDKCRKEVESAVRNAFRK